MERKCNISYISTGFTIFFLWAYLVGITTASVVSAILVGLLLLFFSLLLTD